MRLPAPEVGRVVHYGFVWAGPARRPPPDAAKARPCLIVDVNPITEAAAGGRTATRVTYLPISHTPPRDDERAIEIPPRVARYLGLTHATSYLYVSYAVQDDWPFDLEPFGGTDDCDYGVVPPRLFEAVAAMFASFAAAHPDTVHQRDG